MQRSVLSTVAPNRKTRVAFLLVRHHFATSCFLDVRLFLLAVVESDRR